MFQISTCRHCTGDAGTESHGVLRKAAGGKSTLRDREAARAGESSNIDRCSGVDSAGVVNGSGPINGVSLSKRVSSGKRYRAAVAEVRLSIRVVKTGCVGGSTRQTNGQIFGIAGDCLGVLNLQTIDLFGVNTFNIKGQRTRVAKRSLILNNGTIDLSATCEIGRETAFISKGGSPRRATADCGTLFGRDVELYNAGCRVCKCALRIGLEETYVGTFAGCCSVYINQIRVGRYTSATDCDTCA